MTAYAVGQVQAPPIAGIVSPILNRGFRIMKHVTASLVSLAGLLVLAGCGQSPTANSTTTDPAAIYASAAGVQSQTQAMPDEFETTTYDDGMAAKGDMTDPMFAAMTGGAQTEATIDPAFWFRLISSHERHFDVQFEQPDTMTVLARVHITDRLLGTFNVVTRPDTIEGQITERSWIKKPLADTAVRNAVFVRHRTNDDDAAGEAEDREDGFHDGWSPWRLRQTSGTEITSDGGTRAILSVRIQAGDVDLTVTDPLALVRRADLARIAPGTPVEVTATTGDATDAVVLYARWGRMRMRPGAAPGEFVGRFLAPSHDGLRHIAVNALAHDTVFTDNGPYDSKAWGIPFVVGVPDVAAQP